MQENSIPGWWTDSTGCTAQLKFVFNFLKKKYLFKKKKKTDVNCSIIFGGRELEVVKDWLSVFQNRNMCKKLLAYYQVFHFLF